MLLGVLTKKPGVGAAILSALEAAPEYENARKAGLPPMQASGLAIASGTGTYLLERAGLESIAGKNPAVQRAVSQLGDRWITKAALSYGTEGSQEGLQQMYQNAVARGYDGDRDLFENVLESIYSGGVFGFTVSSAQSAAQKYGQVRMSAEMKKALDKELVLRADPNYGGEVRRRGSQIDLVMREGGGVADAKEYARQRLLEELADADLTAHCRNNFIEALEFIKAACECCSADEAR
jgi:hypothetical protein